MIDPNETTILDTDETVSGLANQPSIREMLMEIMGRLLAVALLVQAQQRHQHASPITNDVPYYPPQVPRWYSGTNTSPPQTWYTT